ncbi:MAG: hypothetical protein GY953_25210 [bacterium]|nr:hypothetical protein [bacterium]
MRLIVGAIVVCSLVCAAPPVAKITSSEGFRIAGVWVPVAGVPDWPLVIGDSVSLGKAPGKVSLDDGSVLFLLPNSKFTVEISGGRTVVRLTDGGLAYKFIKDSRVKLAVIREPVPKQSREGRVMAFGGEAYWDPADPAYHLATRDGGSRRLPEPPGFGNGSRLTPFNLDLVRRWRGFNPGFGTPPGGGPPSGEVPPPTVVDPPENRPVSNWRP